MPEKNEGSSREEVTTEEHSFDALAKQVADGTLPRSKALKSVFAAFVGGLLGGFALPHRAEARKRRPLKTLWGVFEPDARLVRGTGVSGAFKPVGTTGRYEVVFERDVDNCAYFATLTGGFVGLTGVDEGFASHAVTVYTVGGNGLENLPFHVVVHC